MWAVIAHGLAARRGQTAILTLVALLASAAIAAGAWYGVALTRDVAVDAVASAPVADRLITVIRRTETDQPHPDDPAGDVRRLLDPAGFTAVAGGNVSVHLRLDSGAGSDDPPADVSDDTDGEDDAGRVDPAAVRLAYREEACDHLALTGQCPAAENEVAISSTTADALGLVVGDEVEVEQGSEVLGRIRVVGVYGVADTGDPYWGSGELIGRGAGPGRETVFTTLATLHGYQRVTYSHELLIEPAALARMDIDELQAEIAVGVAELRAGEYVVAGSELAAVSERLTTDRRNAVLGVAVGIAVLLLLTWFALAVVLRAAATQLRGDVGWWRLHGAPAGRGWVAALSQSVAPLLGGAALGAAAGLGVGQALVDDLDPADRRMALALALGLVGVSLAGGLVVVVTTQVRVLRTPVRDLLRRVPARSRRWRRSLVDLLVLLVAAAAVAQAVLVGREAEGVALLAPALIVLALALVAAWAVPPLAAALTLRALHAGRLAVALVAASLARRTGSHRVFALVAVAVALVTTGFVGWDTDTRSAQQRATLETGADRVLTVEAPDTAQLLAAVRAADPTGTGAMAAVYLSGRTDPDVLAVDSTRLGVVAGWRPEYGGGVDEVAATLRPSAPEPIVITGDQLVIEAAATGGAGEVDGAGGAGEEVRLRALLRTRDTGEPVEAIVGPVAEAVDSYPVPVPACAAAGCRLVGFELLDPVPGAQVDLYQLAGADGATVGAPVLADPTRWRTGLRPLDLCPAVAAAGGGGLRLRVPPPPFTTTLAEDPNFAWGGCWVFPVETPVPLPVLAAGWRAELDGEARLAPLPGREVPVQVAGTASLVPSVGRTTDTVVVDLEYAERLVPFAALRGRVAQVWLSPDAPPSIVDDLRAAGVTPVEEASLATELARLRQEGNAVGVRFRTLLALVGLLLAAGAVLVHSAQEGTGRAAELAALRVQGVPARVVRAVGYGGAAAVAAAAAVAGIVAGLAGAVVARILHPGFVDGWADLPTAPPHPFPVGVAVAVAALVLGTAALTSAVALVRRAVAVTRPAGGSGPAGTPRRTGQVA